MVKGILRGRFNINSAVFYFVSLIFLLLLITTSHLVKTTTWWLDNLLSLQLQWVLLTLLFILLTVKWTKQRLLILTLLSVTAIMSIQFTANPLADRQGSAQQILKIAQLNIHYENAHIDKLLLTLSTANYDVLVLQEVGDNWQKKIQTLSRTYPYSIGTGPLNASPSGLVLLSKWPIAEQKIHDFGYSGGHIIEAIVQSPKSNKAVQIFTLHPVSPRSETLWYLRNATLDHVAQLAFSSLLQYKIIIGDLNTTPWSAKFRQLQKDSQLANSSKRFTYIPSWSYNNSNPLIRLLSSAYIDHCLISDALTVIDKQQQTIQGSDHLLLVTELALR